MSSPSLDSAVAEAAEEQGVLRLKSGATGAEEAVPRLMLVGAAGALGHWTEVEAEVRERSSEAVAEAPAVRMHHQGVEAPVGCLTGVMEVVRRPLQLSAAEVAEQHWPVARRVLDS